MVRVNEPLCTKTDREIFNIQFSVLYNIRSLQSPEKSPMPLAQWNESLFVLAFSSHCSVLVVTWPGLTGCWLMRPIPFKAEISQGWALVSPGEPGASSRKQGAPLRMLRSARPRDHHQSLDDNKSGSQDNRNAVKFPWRTQSWKG